MKLFIPSLGTKLVLRQPFTFLLHDERRNESFWKKFHGEPARVDRGYSNSSGKLSPVKNNEFWYHSIARAPHKETTLPAGTVLSVSRVFIRAGAKDFDSITFNVIKTKGIPVPTGRFWVKLSEINDRLDADIVNEGNPYPNGKFVLYISEKKPYRLWAGEPTIYHQLNWIRNPGNRYASGFGIKHNLEKDTIERMRPYCPYGYMYKVYEKDFTTLEELKSFSQTKGFSLAHFSEFEKAYKNASKPVVEIEDE